MNAAIHLQNEQLHCVLRPDLGGAIVSLRFANIPVLREVAKPTSVRDMGCFALVPFSNRVAKAQLTWQGTNHPIIKMGAVDEHAIHGVAWQKSWQVLETESNFAMLSYEHKADNAWPFAFDVSQTFKLSADSLSMTLSITNQAPTPAPVGLGWAGIRTLPNVQVRMCSLQRQAVGRWGLTTCQHSSNPRRAWM